MENGASINYTENLKSVFESTLSRKLNGTDFGRETVNGLKMAIAYLNSLTESQLTDQQLRHALRLAYYRGLETDYRVLKTA